MAIRTIHIFTEQEKQEKLSKGSEETIFEFKKKNALGLIEILAKDNKDFKITIEWEE